MCYNHFTLILTITFFSILFRFPLSYVLLSFNFVKMSLFNRNRNKVKSFTMWLDTAPYTARLSSLQLYVNVLRGRLREGHSSRKRNMQRNKYKVLRRNRALKESHFVSIEILAFLEPVNDQSHEVSEPLFLFVHMHMQWRTFRFESSSIMFFATIML